MKPTLEDIRTARASARQRRDHNAKRLKRVILRLITRVEAYEHEASLLGKVERDLIANGTSAEIFQLRTETRFDGGVPKTATITPENDPGASSAIRRASPRPSDEGRQPDLSPGGPPPANLPPEQGYHPSNTELVDELTRSYAAGEVF